MTAFRVATAAFASCLTMQAAQADTVKLPPPNGRFDYQLGGPYTPDATVAVVSRDRLVAPAPGKYNICYVNAFQTQPGEANWWKAHHPELLVMKKGRPVTDPNWPDEFIMDTSTPSKRAALIAIVGPWIDKCAKDGYDAVEPDNLDSYLRSKGRLTKPDNIAFAKLLVARSHAANLAIAQKNTADLAPQGRQKVGFDFAIVEECQVYSECGMYTAGYGNLVFEIEYDDNTRDANGKPVDPIHFFKAACAARGRSASVIFRDRLVAPVGSPHYQYRWCP